MRRITLWLLSTIAVVVLAFGYRTSTMGAGGEPVAVATPATTGPAAGATADPTRTPDPTTTAPAPAATSSPTAPASSPAAPAPVSSPAAATGGDGTYPGSTVQTRWGPIQVTITVTGGRITDVAVPVHPNGNHRDEEINAYALPALRQATLDAQGAGIDTVSGATVTSDGYVQSLQAALDAAHLS